jgi:hypothetical protein
MREFTPVPKPVKKEKLVTNAAIRARSKKRAQQEREYARLRKEYLSNHLYCEGNLTGCTTVASEIQHSMGRVGKLLTDVRYFKASCHNCNLRAETHPHEAIANGFSKSRLHD